MQQKDLKLVNRLGLHARAAAKLVQLAGAFRCDVEVGYQDHWVNGKSILGLLLLAAPKGSTVHIRCNGADEDEAVTALSELVVGRFGEAD